MVFRLFSASRSTSWLAFALATSLVRVPVALAQNAGAEATAHETPTHDEHGTSSGHAGNGAGGDSNGHDDTSASADHGEHNTSTIGPAVPTPVNPDTPRDQSTEGEPANANPTATPTPRPRPRRSRPEPEPPRQPGDPDRLQISGMAGAYFYRSQTGRRRARVLVYLHARNANPRESCRTFHQIANRFGWLLCPIGQVDRGGGRREWRNDRDYANRETILALDALAARFPGRVQRHDNVVMGFSEGAYVGMNVGLMNPQTFPRWVIFAADDRYIDSEGERIRRAATLVRRVYLVTGRTDSVLQHTQRAYDQLARVWGRRHIRMRILENAGHELPPEFVRTVRNVLMWVTADAH
jgi:predicted esterase